jgi:DNA-binding transcriptional MerR regulator
MSRDDHLLLSIAQIAQRTELRISTVRYYERAGLLPAPVRTGRDRRYRSAVLQRLDQIRGAQEAGLSLAEIRELCDLRERVLGPD